MPKLLLQRTFPDQRAVQELIHSSRLYFDCYAINPSLLSAQLSNSSFYLLALSGTHSRHLGVIWFTSIVPPDSCVLNVILRENVRLGERRCQTGAALRNTQIKKQIALKLTDLMQNMGVRRVRAYCVVGTGSASLVASLGFRFEGLFRNEHSIGGEPVDIQVFSFFGAEEDTDADVLDLRSE